MKSIQPSNLIGGFSPRDGLDVTMLSAWCSDIGLNVSGNKVALIDRILEYYDSMRRIEIKTEDEREKLIAFYQRS